MPACKIIAVDFPGHGFSDHLSEDGHYEVISRAIQMMQVADALSWEKFSIMGHSLGGAVGSIMAASFPERVEKLGLIDVILFSFVHNTNFNDALNKYYAASRKSRRHSVYSSYDNAAEVRIKINETFPMKLNSAKVLAKGGMRKVEGGYQWTFDTRLLWPSFPVPTSETAEATRHSLNLPIRLIIASEGWLAKADDDWMKRENITVQKIQGHHHLHLDDPEPVAAAFNEFF